MRFLQGRDDRFFPVDFQRRVVRDRLGITPDEMPAGHLVALSRPKELADRLKAYRSERAEPTPPILIDGDQAARHGSITLVRLLARLTESL